MKKITKIELFNRFNEMHEIKYLHEITGYFLKVTISYNEIFYLKYSLCDDDSSFVSDIEEVTYENPEIVKFENLPKIVKENIAKKCGCLTPLEINIFIFGLEYGTSITNYQEWKKNHICYNDYITNLLVPKIGQYNKIYFVKAYSSFEVYNIDEKWLVTIGTGKNPYICKIEELETVKKIVDLKNLKISAFSELFNISSKQSESILISCNFKEDIANEFIRILQKERQLNSPLNIYFKNFGIISLVFLLKINCTNSEIEFLDNWKASNSYISKEHLSNILSLYKSQPWYNLK